MAAKGTALVFKLPTDRGDGGPHAMRNGVAPSSFGMDATTLGPDYGAHSIFGGGRRKELQFRASFFRCENHDWKTNDINGIQIPSGRQSMTQPMLSQNAQAPSYFVPMSSRRPNNPYRLARKIVGSFTGMLFSHGRWPQLRSDDPETQDWAEAIVKACNLQGAMIRARNTGGACGVVGLSWGWVDGRPRVRVHDGALIHCLEWSDEDEQIPKHVTELYKFQRTVVNKKGNAERVDFWHRRDWTELADVVFRDCEVTDDEPVWEIDEERSYVHNHGRIHFEWIANLPDDEVDSTDGQPDYPECYEQLNTLDITNSVVVMGSIRNLDPTLVVKAEADLIGTVIRKGSDNAITPGLNGDAKYLELTGSTITSGMVLVDKEAQQILETCDCVLADPDKIAASGMSSVALKIVYAPMIAKCDIMRPQYGGAMERCIDGLTDFARLHMPDAPGQQVLMPVEEDDPATDEVVLDEDGNPIDPEPKEEAVEFYFNLPPRQIETPVLDADGNPTGEQRVTQEPRRPGTGALSLEWGEYFKPTADDIQKSTQSISQAAGGKSVMSQKTAVELTANLFNRDANQEWVDVSKETAEARTHELAASAGMFPGAGGAPDPDSGLTHKGAFGRDEDEQITVDEAIDQLTVNEVRAALKPPRGPLTMQDGSLNPDGFLPVAEYKAKVSAKGTVDGETEAGAPPVEAPPKQPQGNVPGEPGLTQKPFGGGVGVTPPPTAKTAQPSVPQPPRPPPPKAK